jgi:hypothetical protein
MSNGARDTKARTTAMQVGALLSLVLGAAACAARPVDTVGETTQADTIALNAFYNFGTLVSPGSCMDSRSAGTSDGTQIQEWSCNGTGAQSFQLVDAGNGAVSIVNTNANKCVDVADAGTADGTQVRLWDCNGTGAQSYWFEPTADGFFNIVNTNSNKCLDVQSSNPANGTVVQLWGCDGTDAQVWNASNIGSPSAPSAPSGPVQGVAKSSGTTVFVHMMPWFEDPTTSGNGQWGIHWTMANQNPDVIEASGQRQIASYYYPLIGPYGSSDPDVIEYQLLLMKYSGIGGVLIDWPGTIQYADYPKNVQNSEAIMAKTAQFGLQFGVVYEDNNVTLAAEAGAIPSDLGDEIGAATNDMAYVQKNYFTKSNYVQLGGAPLLLDFGPQTFLVPADWSSIFSAFSQAPTFLTLWYQSNEAGSSAQGEFPWIYTDFMTGLQNFYANRPLNVKLGVAYPGFNPFYAAGGWPGPTWTLPYDGTGTIQQTFQLAMSNVGFVQVATWNDYGEGTMIEPTAQFGYGALTTLQQALGVPYSQSELELVATLFSQRKQYAGNASQQATLDQASADLAAYQVDAAASLLGASP